MWLFMVLNTRSYTVVFEPKKKYKTKILSKHNMT